MSKVALLINLGSPKSPGVKDVKEYLGEFLMDDHVIDVPKIPRWLLVKGIILNVRPKKSADAYKSIWWDEGSPLITLSERLVKKVREHSLYETYLAMRYAAPSISNKLKEIHDKHPDLEELYVVPLYPHFAMSSYESVVDRVKEIVEKEYPGLKLNFKKPWFDEESYIQILTESIVEVLPKDHHLLFSYHGIPVRHLRKSDSTSCHCYKRENCCTTPSEAHGTCYKHQTTKTTELVVKALGLKESQYSTSYQSRLGRDPWIEPYTAERLEQLPSEGKDKLAIVCPAFVSDCLETLEEINIEGREEFLSFGGTSFVSIPCLNDRNDWAQLVAEWINNGAL